MINIPLTSVVGTNCTISTQTKKQLIAVSTTSDPSLYNSSISFSGDQQRYMLIRAKLTYTGTSPDTVGEVFYGTTDATGADANRKSTFTLKLDSQFHTYVLDMHNPTYSSAGLWKGKTVNYVRLDFGNNNNLSIEVTYWKIYTYMPHDINGIIAPTTFTSSTIISKTSLEEIRAAVTNLDNYLINVDNCGNCYTDYNVTCETCQGCQVCEACQSCQNNTCQGCQSCQGCQTCQRCQKCQKQC